MKIELVERRPGCFFVRIGDLFSDELGADEALGVIASALFNREAKPPYIGSYEDWFYWNKRYCPSNIQEPVALLENKSACNRTLVVFKGASIEQIKWGGHDDPREILTVGKIYLVEKREIHAWHTQIKLIGIDGWFNDVSFERLP